MAKFVKPTVKTITEFGNKVFGDKKLKYSETQKIELAGRTCYNSFDKLKEGSDKTFCRSMIKSKHDAMVEFGHAILKVDADTFEDIRYANCKHLNMTEYDDNYLVSGNVRAWRDFITSATFVEDALREYMLFHFIENKEYQPLFGDIDWNHDVDISSVKYQVMFYNEFNLTEEEKKKHKYYHFVIETDRGIMAEITRHRNSSFAIRSTRYVNFVKGAEFVMPHWYNKSVEGIVNTVKHTIGKWAWRSACKSAETSYKIMIHLGFKPQDARAVLPNSLMTLINISGNLENFEWIFHLRSAKSAHPDIRIISDKMKRIVEMDR